VFFQNRRVEEELERIRKANLPPARKDEGETNEPESIDVSSIEDAVEFETTDSEMTGVLEKPAQSDDLKLTSKDIFAMIIAALSIVIPYALLFIGIAVVFIYLFFR
jgi:hypothetical protein